MMMLTNYLFVLVNRLNATHYFYIGTALVLVRWVMKKRRLSKICEVGKELPAHDAKV